MSTAPVITIFVRHSADCKHRGDEFAKACRCRKHFRWTQHGEQERRKAGTRSWAEAENIKRRLEDQLAGRVPTDKLVTGSSEMTLRGAVKVFEASKAAQGVGPSVRYAYNLQLSRLCDFCESRQLFAVKHALTLENLLLYRETWTKRHKSSYSRHVIQAHIKHFLRFAHDSQWIDRVPPLSSIKKDQPETQPLTEAEYKKVLDAVYGTVEDPKTRGRYIAMLELMRWSGLAVRDACTLKRTDIVREGKVFKIIRPRTKTGTPLYVPIPPSVAKQLETVTNGNPVYVFWDKRKLDSSAYSFTGHWSSRISDIFKVAGIESEGHMISHRLRATFAVDLLKKGVALEHVSKLLGHRSVTTTEKHYAKWVKGRQDLLDRVVSQTW